MLIAEITLVSLGEAARLIGTSLQGVIDAAEALGIHAAERRDGVPYLFESDVEKIRRYLTN